MSIGDILSFLLWSLVMDKFLWGPAVVQYNIPIYPDKTPVIPFTRKTGIRTLSNQISLVKIYSW
jgi:hypothetical protein